MSIQIFEVQFKLFQVCSVFLHGSRGVVPLKLEVVQKFSYHHKYSCSNHVIRQRIYKNKTEPPNFSAKFFSALQGITIMSRKKKNPALRKPYMSTFHLSRTRIIPSCLKSESRNCSSSGAYRRHITVIFYLLANTEIPRHVQTYRCVVAEILARQHPSVAIHSHFRPVIEHAIVAEVYVQLVFNSDIYAWALRLNQPSYSYDSVFVLVEAAKSSVMP